MVRLTVLFGLWGNCLEHRFRHRALCLEHEYWSDLLCSELPGELLVSALVEVNQSPLVLSVALAYLPRWDW